MLKKKKGKLTDSFHIIVPTELTIDVDPKYL